MQNTWHTPKKILIAVEVIAKNSRYPDLPAPIVLVYASTRAAAVTSAKNFQHLNALRSKWPPPAVVWIPAFPLLCTIILSPPFNNS